MALFQNHAVSLSVGTDHPEIVNGLGVASNFFSVLGVHPMLGRDFLPAETTKGRDNEIILSWDAWQRYFHGDPGAIGQTLRLGGTPQTVVGVLPRDFSLPHLNELPGSTPNGPAMPYEVFGPLVYGNEFTDLGDFNYMAIGRLRVGASEQQAQAELVAIQSGFNQARHLPVSPSVVVIPLLSEVAGHVSTALWLLLAAVGAVLLIGCANLANLQLARAVSREREFAIRAALGAGRDRLLWSALADSLVLAAVGGSLGILLSFAGVRAFVAAAPQNLPRVGGIEVSWPVLAGAAALSMFTALLFGVLPALRSMRVDPQSAMQTSTQRVSASRESRSTRQVLVAAEVACTVALLIVTGLLVRSFSTLLTQNRDFDSSHLTLASVFLYAPQYGDQSPKSQAVRAAFMDRAIADLGHIPGVQSVASTSEQPMAGATWIDEVVRPDHPLPDGQNPDANIRWISPGYASTLRIPVLAGRDFTPDEKNHVTNALISQQAARTIWPGENPIGKTVQARRRDHLHRGGRTRRCPHQRPETCGQHGLPALLGKPVVARKLPDPQLAIQHALWRRRSSAPSGTSTRRLRFQPSLRWTSKCPHPSPRSASRRCLLTSFGGAALLLALLGIYGVLAYSVSLRQQEFGIRIALGCEKTALMGFVARQAMVPVLAGIVAGLVLAFVASRWVHSMLYETSAADPVAITGSIALLLATALLASLLPARRAAQVDPAQVSAQRISLRVRG